mmetsp:Transcript_75898/g.214626  ORF Transcript_75898/g.214626 Transcript_75898/m.214626 type:complete len:297 (+) Transcript_75898:80-970(+)
MRVCPTAGCGADSGPGEKHDAVSLRGHTLVIPGLGLSPLGEFCVDAVVATFGLSRRAIIQSRQLVPLAMASAWETGRDGQSAECGLTTAAELYQSPNAPQLSVLQIRSAVLSGCRRAMVEEIWAWACREGVAQVLVVGPCSSHVKVDHDLAASTNMRYIQAGLADLPALEAKLGPGVFPLVQAAQEDESGEETAFGGAAGALQKLRGAGLARLFLSAAGRPAPEGAAADTSPPNVLCLVGYTTEVLDWQLTQQLTDTVCAFLAKQLAASAPTPQFKAPPSWRLEQEAARMVPPLWG